jgi:hypothetical protein
MADTIGIAKNLGIRNAGKDERWLQDQVWENPACLGLGELEVFARERRQSSGGRVDMVLINSDEDTMYEVEIMLGKTNESHIIRTIEYWDLERRRYPKRKHIAVLVAEEITQRFFNVIQLLSNNIPIIAIQASLVEVNGHLAMHFTTVLNICEEDDADVDDDPSEVCTPEKCLEKYPLTVETAGYFKDLISGRGIIEGLTLRYLVHTVQIVSSTNNKCFEFSNRAKNSCQLFVRVRDEQYDELSELLYKNNLDQTKTRGGRAKILKINKQFIKDHEDVFIKIAEYVKDFIT